MASKTISLVLSYRDTEYGRFRALLEAAQLLPNYEIQLLQNSSSHLGRYWQTFWKLLWRPEKKGVYLLGFRGLEIYWLVRLLVGKQSIILDALMSPSLALQSEKSSLLKHIAPFLFSMEKAIYHNAQRVLVDTESHRKLFIKTFALPPEKVVVLPVGAEESVFSPGKNQEKRPFTVLYYFSGQKLHGLEVLRSVLRKLQQDNIHFLLVGPQAKYLRNFQNVETFHHIPYRLLPRFINRADLCLVGPFSNSPQANRVITTKAYQCLAMKKTIVMGENAESTRYFQHQKNALLVPLSQTKALLNCILWASKNQKKLPEIADAGWNTYKRVFSSRVRAQQLRKFLDHV